MDRNTGIVELSADQLDQVSGAAGIDGIRALATLSSTVASSQNAENVRSQAEKRLETQRKDLVRNWGG
jgi:hypothetical protein